ncbi:hypothetical protein, variant 1 [Aphanomyces invadans]|uniref:F-box domain-containing protein n=1 Tax=Aphanomyces invadans TaxID=157072 RepID=A0A024U7G1_9STRA|nr:hypothetical protein, variant 1 [Aphanomyces invadans]ETW02160.1 hypothetical protein, variant 1 [Aphanomyces invadans]|eukprot:XP_008868765.1 hypothetical protein, variant 1 [Aphanomyces invadans]
MVLRGGNQVAAAALFLFSEEFSRPTTASTSPTPLTRKKGKGKRKQKPPETGVSTPKEPRPEKNEQYADQLTGLMGKERQRLAQQVMIAAEKGNKKAIYLLLHQRMLTPSHCIGLKGFSPLHHASSRGHLDIAQMLLSFGWPIDRANDMGETALHLACYGGHAHLVEFFLDKGAHIDAINKVGLDLLQSCINITVSAASQDAETPLFYAARKGHFRVVRVLLRRDANVNHRNRFDDLPEDEASNDATRLEFTSSKGEISRTVHRTTDGDAALRSIHRETILSFLDTKSLGMAMQVCFRWNRAADTPRLWKSLGVSRWELSLNKSVGLGVVAPMTGYRPTPRRRPSTTSSTSPEGILNATGHLGYHRATPSKLQLQHQHPQNWRRSGQDDKTSLPPRPQTAMRLVQYR